MQWVHLQPLDDFVPSKKTPNVMQKQLRQTQKYNPSTMMLGGRNPLLKSVQSSIKIA